MSEKGRCNETVGRTLLHSHEEPRRVRELTVRARGGGAAPTSMDSGQRRRVYRVGDAQALCNLNALPNVWQGFS